jgi:hypothetical protein
MYHQVTPCCTTHSKKLHFSFFFSFCFYVYFFFLLCKRKRKRKKEEKKKTLCCIFARGARQRAMWKACREQERKIQGIMHDHKKRAERKAAYFAEKVLSPPLPITNPVPSFHLLMISR